MLSEHGDYGFEWRGNLLILTLSGGFNEAAIAHFFQQVLASFAGRGDSPWAILSSIDKGMMGTPEVIKIIKTAYRWGETHYCKAAAISGANVIVHRIYSELFEKLSYDAELFDSKEEAIEWLENKLK